MSKLTLLAAAGAGYVLGARAGRERYETIKDGAQRFARNPRVKSAAGKAQETVAQQAPVVAGAVKDKAAAAASTVQDKLHRTDDAAGTGPVASEPTPATAPPLS